ncbi:hypothetical protein [Faecalibaculum rodentium]|nr:hypothetical protein [Faecalibaculum rodentium]
MEQTMTVNGWEFQVITLLGHGKGGYSWLVSREGREYVLKQIHHEPCDYYVFGDKLEAEERDYQRLRNAGIPVPGLLDIDRIQERILKEHIPGRTVCDLVAEGSLPQECVRQVQALSKAARDAGLNLDWFPTNFIPFENRLFYVDYECNAYMEEWSLEHWGLRYWTRTPEFLEYWKQHSGK